MQYLIIKKKNGQIGYWAGEYDELITTHYPPDTVGLYFSHVKPLYANTFVRADLVERGIIPETLKNSQIFFYDLDLVKEMGYHLGNGSVNKSPTDFSSYKNSNYQKFKLTRYKKDMKFGNISSSYNVTRGLPYTFGVEIETASGYVPGFQAFHEDLNLNCERDGSITGGEYVTGVLTGDAGFIHLNKILGFLRKQTTINKTCGIHVHIGNAAFNNDFTVFAFMLGRRLEREIFKTLPASRTNNRYCDFLSKLPVDESSFYEKFDKYGYKAAVDIIYDELYTAMSYGDRPSRSTNKLVPHKYGRYTGQYHDICMDDNFRYKWLNLIPLNFNMKGADDLDEVKMKSTLEFRCHSASLSYTKIKNWILLCMAFTNFVENYKNDILDQDIELNISYILNKVYGEKRAKSLVKYFNSRKELFSDAGKEKEEYTKIERKTLKNKIEICA